MDVFAQLGAWAHAHRAVVLGLGGGGAGAAAYIIRKRRGASASPDATMGTPTPVDASAGQVGGISASDAFSALLGNQQAFQGSMQGALSSLQQQIANLAPPTPVAGAPRPPWRTPPGGGLSELLRVQRERAAYTQHVPPVPAGLGGIRARPGAR